MRARLLALGLLFALVSGACEKQKSASKARDNDSESDDDDDGKKKRDKKSADPDASGSGSARADASAPTTALPTVALPPATAAPPARDPLLAGYSLYSTPAGGYELLMPAGAKESEHTLKSGTIQHRVSASRGPGQDLMAYWQEMGTKATPEALAAARDAGVNLLEQPTTTPIKVGPHDGFDVAGKPKSGGNKVMHLRMFMANNRMYGLIDTDLSDQESKAWMSSFKLGDGSSSSTDPAQAKLSPKCEEYWATSKKCNAKMLSQIPEGASKEQASKALADAEKQTREAWKGMPSGALDQACAQMIEALKSNPSCKD